MIDSNEPQNIDELHAVVFHEIRSPMTVVRGYIDLLSRPLSEHERSAAVKAAGVALNRLDALLDDFLTGFARDGSVLGGTAETVNLSSIAREVVREQTPLFGGTLTLRTESDDACLVSGAPARIRQLVENLILNAMKYGGVTGIVEVTVTAHPDHVELVVADSGPGIPESERDRIFEPFVRLERDRSLKGNGIGLWLARSVAVHCGGALEVGSAPGGGASFEARLPRHPADMPVFP